MNGLRFGTITNASGPMRVRQDGAASDLVVSCLVGAAPALDDRVLWAVVDGKVVVFTYTDVS